MRFHIPICLPSLANARLCWRSMVKIKRQQRLATKLCMATVEESLPPPPLIIIITKIGPRRLDDDNLAAACKYVRDQIAAAVGVDDGSDQYTWKYEQRTGQYGVDVEIISR